MIVKFEYIIDKVTKLDNGEVEIIATGISSENIATTISPEMEMLMRSIPPQMRELMNQQQKMFQEMQKPMIKFRITGEEYSEGRWKVGDMVEVTIAEKDF
ncbi:MAG: hypothetical protein DRN33_05005 [Thermoplasmata archaeon]|jgi:hypothetical protein|nr:MAG: hypothetical protein DRN33_05005 [Thermoplasmata archaeon]